MLALYSFFKHQKTPNIKKHLTQHANSLNMSGVSLVNHPNKTKLQQSTHMITTPKI